MEEVAEVNLANPLEVITARLIECTGYLNTLNEICTLLDTKPDKVLEVVKELNQSTYGVTEAEVDAILYELSQVKDMIENQRYNADEARSYAQSVYDELDEYQVEEVERLVKKLRSNITPTEEPDEESSGKESNGVKDTAVKVVVNN